MKTASINDFQIHDFQGANVNGIYFSKYQGLDFPRLRHSGQVRSGTDGYDPISSLWGERLIPIEGWIEGADLAAYKANRRTFAQQFAQIRDANGDPTLYSLKFTDDDDAEYQLDVTLSREPTFSDIGMMGCAFFLPLIAPDPQIYSQTLVTTTPITGPTGGGAELPFELPVTLGELGGGTVVVSNLGTFYTWPVITLTGALTNPYLYNATTGKAWQLQYTSGVNDTIVIDMRPDQQTAILNGAQSLFDVVDPTSVWWWLESGNNTINFSSGSTADTGTMTMALRYAWLGV